MYIGKCKHGKVIASCVGPSNRICEACDEETLADNIRDIVQFAMDVISFTRSGLSVSRSNQTSVCIESCDECFPPDRTEARNEA